jgi:hypothetical protein
MTKNIQTAYLSSSKQFHASVQPPRRMTVDTGILRRRAVSEKLLASMISAQSASELRSAITVPILGN